MQSPPISLHAPVVCYRPALLLLALCGLPTASAGPIESAQPIAGGPSRANLPAKFQAKFAARKLDKRAQDMPQELRRPEPPTAVLARAAPLVPRRATTLTASTLSGLTTAFSTSADGDVIEVSADMTLTAEMWVLRLLLASCPLSGGGLDLHAVRSGLNCYLSPFVLSRRLYLPPSGENSDKSVTVTSASGGTYKLDGGGSSSDFSMFKVYGSFEATFSNLDIVNGNVVTDGGAAFYVSGAGQLTLVSVTLSGHNTAASGGAIIWISTANFVAMDCTFSDNEATGDGGAIHVTNASKLVSSCSFFLRTHTFLLPASFSLVFCLPKPKHLSPSPAPSLLVTRLVKVGRFILRQRP